MRPRATFEAAHAAASVGGYAQARLLLGALLADDPFDAEYLSAMAQTYVGEASPEALALFDLATAARIDRSPLPSGEQTLRHTALDRIMIAALDGLGNHRGALDRHITLIERDPDGNDSIAETARHAARHDLWEELARHYDGDHPVADDPRLHQIAGAKLRHYLEGRLPREAEMPEVAARAERLASLLPEDLPAPPPPVQQAVVQQAVVSQAQNAAPASSAGQAVPAAESVQRASAGRGAFCIQVGAFKEIERATGLATDLERHGFSAWVASGDGYERVLVGEFKTWTEATAMERDLRNAGFETWVRRVPSCQRASADPAGAWSQR
jgi:cell division septation protein DedD